MVGRRPTDVAPRAHTVPPQHASQPRGPLNARHHAKHGGGRCEEHCSNAGHDGHTDPPLTCRRHQW
eukprot:5049231-Amphidinium_carterae.1